MNQITINAVLQGNENEDLLEFIVNENSYMVDLNNESCQQSLKNVFAAILNELLENDIFIVFNCQEGYTRGLYKEVCEKVIEDINRELSEIKETLRDELKV